MNHLIKNKGLHHIVVNNYKYFYDSDICVYCGLTGEDIKYRSEAYVDLTSSPA